MMSVDAARPPGLLGHHRAAELADAWHPHRARAIVSALLTDLPDRLAHSLRAGHQARQVAHTVTEQDAPWLVSAALLHDIGYARVLRRTGFHPLDGAYFLRDLGAPQRLAALVAHHSEARLLAAANGTHAALTEFAHEDGPVTDALIWADMTSGPSGLTVGVADRLADIAERHRTDPPGMRSGRLARVPRIVAATRRVEHRAAGTAGR